MEIWLNHLRQIPNDQHLTRTVLLNKHAVPQDCVFEFGPVNVADKIAL